MTRNLVRRYRNVFFVGLPGVGKSTLGKTYAAHTYRSFYDLDTVIEREHGKTIAEIFASEGEEAFRMIEHATLLKLAKRQNIVLSLGGGALSSDETFRTVAEHGLIVHLKEDHMTLAKRILNEPGKRPLFQKVQAVEEAVQVLAVLWERRRPWFERAHLELDLRFSSVDAVKIELSTFERRAFRRTYVHDLQSLGDSLPQAPDLQVHQKMRYVLRERPYLFSQGDSAVKSRQRNNQKSKKALGRNKRARLADGGARTTEALRSGEAQGKEHSKERRRHPSGNHPRANPEKS